MPNLKHLLEELQELGIELKKIRADQQSISSIPHNEQ